MVDLLDYIQETLLTGFHSERLKSGVRALIDNNENIISIIHINDYENAFNTPIKGDHYYTRKHFKLLNRVVKLLKIGEFEVIVEKGFPLTLKTPYFYISIAPRVYSDGEEDEEGDMDDWIYSDGEEDEEGDMDD
jgi:hypothetical protein